MRICPCCGFKSDSIVRSVAGEGCTACGARAVGEPLPRPEHELPSYFRSLVLVITGALMVLVFLIQTVIALAQRTPSDVSRLALASIVPLDFWSWVAAAETASWRLKWAAIPATLFVLFVSRKLYHSILQSPAGFCGLRYARRAYVTSLAVLLLILVMIGITLPERLRHRQWGIEAGTNALAYTTDRVLREYRQKFGTFPSDKKDLARLPDPDGSIAAFMKEIDISEYKVSAELASVPKQNPRPLRGAVIRNASLSTTADEPLSEGLSFTNYELRLPGMDKVLGTEDDLLMRDGVINELRLPGPDKVLGTEDDLIVHDGVITKASESPRRVNAPSAATQKRQP